MSDWLFADPENLATITVRQIVVDGDPILRVSHDEDDGGWQFLTGGQVEMKDAMLVGLGEIVALDPSVIELADLPLGWRATRENPDSPWQREPQ
jgi:hypothetical protein